MSTAVGRVAEDAAANFLVGKGHKVLARNWRTRWCEIDIVSQKAGVIYFTEVKYRSNAYHGDGLDYITPAKLRQMHFAAELWMASKGSSRQDYRLAAIAASGNPPQVQAWIDDIAL